MTPTHASPDFDGALEEFDRFCRFIDGMHMGGFVENDFMCKPVQQKIRTALQACRAEVLTVEEQSRVLIDIAQHGVYFIEKYIKDNGLKIMKENV